MDIEALIAECVPGGAICDPQAVADAIRAFFAGGRSDGAHARLLAAAKELSAMYAHAWDRAYGGLVMVQPSVPRFEAAHREMQLAIHAITGDEAPAEIDG